ncbi:ABC transporter permease [Streptomyces sp. NPDC058459]|uniref:ABC transporter permease n=1 Tax=Streptomyces sp. NPDC058459 TaxID=3346508 RepID=UPI00364F099F
MTVRQYARDLGMGARFAVTGGREGWIRTALTAVGVGMGVALLLLTTALPGVISARHAVEERRSDFTFTATPLPRGDDTLLLAATDTWWRAASIRGRLLEPEGPKAPLPPGVDHFPAKGEMLVSPALGTLLASGDAKQLRARLPYRITGTIGSKGLIGPRELVYVAGAEGMRVGGAGARVVRLRSFGDPQPRSEEADPVLLMMVLVVFVVLLMPVAVFIAAAVRFGGERRDRRLAALRLVGADSRTTRRIAAGEALAGSLIGLVIGAGLFLAGRQLAGSVTAMGESFYPAYLDPSPLLVLLVALAVPACAVLVTLLAMRGVVIEPLGVVRTAVPARRRLWWRLLLPLAGLALLYPMLGQGRSNGDFNQYLVTAGVLLLLVGITALLPWLVERAVARLDPGPLSWQLAVRRLQLSSGTAARTVNGVAVAVAGAIALQMLFAGVQGAYVRDTGQDPSRAQLEIALSDRGQVGPAAASVARTRGVRASVGLATATLGEKPRDADASLDIVVGDCASLRELAHLPSCRDGDTFALSSPEYRSGFDRTSRDAVLRPGHDAYIDPAYADVKGLSVPVAVPKHLRWVTAREDSLMSRANGLLVTPAAFPKAAEPALSGQVFVRMDQALPDVQEYVRNTVARVDPLAYITAVTPTETSFRYTSLRTGMLIGASCVLVLIGASLLVSQLEQLRDRRRLLSALVALGTRRRTLGLSVLWQSALPIALGLLLASVVGVLLGAVLLKMSAAEVTVVWPDVLTLTGVGAGVVLAVTLFTLPPLLRMTRPDGLRTE